MSTQDIAVHWPKKLALIMPKTELRPPTPAKVVEPVEYAAYALGYSKEKIVCGVREIVPMDPPQMMVALESTFKCPVHGAYYLPWVFARPLDGKMLPTGKLTVILDGEPAMEGAILDFLPDLEPLDCMKRRVWKKTKFVFPAHVLLESGEADGSNQIGFMMTNQTKAEIRLADVTAEEKVSLEVGFVAAYYSTKKSEVQ